MTNANDILLDKMQKLAASYLPEWNFSTNQPDAGSVLALLYKNMLEDSAHRVDISLHKHKIAYLNLFDRFMVEPAEAAKGFVRFSPVEGVTEPVHVPAGTRLLADSDKIDHAIVFETTHGITVTPAQIEAIFTTDASSGQITQQFSKQLDVSTDNYSFTAFRTGEENLEQHQLVLGFENSLDHLQSLDMFITISTLPQEDAVLAVQKLCAQDISFSVLGKDGPQPFDKVEFDNDKIHLVKEYFTPVKANLLGRECVQIAVNSPRPSDIQISGIGISLTANQLLPDWVQCGGVIQNIGHFLPFGLPMEIYAACEIECKTLLARTGAQANLSFMLDYEMLERKLPEYEIETEYKVIMKKAPTAPKLVVQQAHADYVLVEYLSENGWKRLCQDEHISSLFSGALKGKINIPFEVPADILDFEYADGQPRLRLRLLRADNLYQIPSVQQCPVIDDLRFSYAYSNQIRTPDLAVTCNNFALQDIASLFDAQRTATLFYTNEHEKTAMYIGFAQNPWGTPISMYLSIENSGDYPVDFTVEYLADTGFIAQKVVDGTGGMLHSGNMLLMVGQDITAKELYGQTLYWLRLINHTKEQKLYRLPRISGIYMNMTRVENARTSTEYFYIDSSDSAVKITLSEQNIISAKVYVNEQDASDGDNWVLWQKLTPQQADTRVYTIDSDGGNITFAKNIFAIHPVKEDGAAVKVVFQNYHGSSANVKAGQIKTLAQSIQYISSVENPMPAFGGYDGFNEQTTTSIISNMLRTRGRAVTQQDYFDIISQVSYGVRRIKCVSGCNMHGTAQEDAVTIAILIDEYEKGGHIFSGIKQSIRQKLLDCSGIIPAGNTLILTQPRFVSMSTRLWITCERMENAYDLQKQCTKSICSFIDPLQGGFQGEGWQIGTLPTPTQLVAYLKLLHPQLVVSKIVMTAKFEDREYAVDDTISRQITSPFAMAVNGEHVVYSQLVEG